jgi:hypothetical protein
MVPFGVYLFNNSFYLLLTEFGICIHEGVSWQGHMAFLHNSGCFFLLIVKFNIKKLLQIKDRINIFYGHKNTALSGAVFLR